MKAIDMKRKRLCNYDVQLWLPENERESEDDPGFVLVSGTGWFHCWANDIEADGKDQLNNITVGIVEDDKTGKVYNVHPNNIQFIKD
jgi:hypothetical protein